MFAPHYAAPLLRRLARAAELRLDAESASESLASLGPGERFEVLEIAGEIAWGRAPGPGLVGYLPADALDAP